jgi:hydroxymethylglutaryl-CoA lyase
MCDVRSAKCDVRCANGEADLRIKGVLSIYRKTAHGLSLIRHPYFVIFSITFETMNDLKIIECPRDAMQGISEWIPTDAKVSYINQLLRVGFDTIDFGSFVSPKAIPQMRDTAEVLSGLELDGSKSKLLAIVANARGAQDAAEFGEIQYLGYPFSISETFQQRNTNAGIEESLGRVGELADICAKNHKELVVYVSMGFGNPYGDAWSPELAVQWCERLYREFDVRILALSDTIGVGTPDTISALFNALIPSLPQVEFGAHLHTTPDRCIEKLEAALQAGCKRFDGAIKGWGGCPMATDKLTGNMPTEMMIGHLQHTGVELGLNDDAFRASVQLADSLFAAH